MLWGIGSAIKQANGCGVGMPILRRTEHALTKERTFDVEVNFGRAIKELTTDDFTVVNATITPLTETVANVALSL